jgi:hypothetical protein
MRHTLSDRLFHSDPAKVSSSTSSSINRTAPNAAPGRHETSTNNSNAMSTRKEESDDEDMPFSDGPSPIPSPRVRTSGLLPHENRGVLERIGLFGGGAAAAGAGGGKKQFFATPAKYSDYTSPVATSAHDAL